MASYLGNRFAVSMEKAETLNMRGFKFIFLIRGRDSPLIIQISFRMAHLLGKP